VQILETYLEFVLRPCQRALVDYWPRPKPARMDPFFTGTNKPERLWQRIVYAGPDPEELCATGQLNELLSEHIRQLPPPIRDALQLYFLKGLSAVDTCHVLGIGNAALKGRIFRGRRMADALRLAGNGRHPHVN